MSLRAWVLLSLCALCAAETVGDGVVRLENAQVVVEVVPRLGGRITALRRPGGDNVIASVPALMASAAGTLPQPGVEGTYLHGLGHVVWIGPQRDWWTQQDANPARRDARATWPPDPFLEYGDMQVVGRGPDHLSLLGPVSPVSGLRLRSEIRIAADGAVSQLIEAVNASPRTVTWDIWPNTRVRDGTVFAPYERDTRLRLEHGTFDPVAERPLPAAVRDGYLSFNTVIAAGEEGMLHTGKAFMVSTRPRLFAFSGQDLLIVAAPAPGAGKVHPDHAPVEIFQCAGGDPIRAVLELEFHSPCRTLAPGASMRYAVAWRVVPAGPGDRIAILRAHEPDAARLGELADAVAR